MTILFLACSASGEWLNTKQIRDLYEWGTFTRGRYGPNVIEVKDSGVMWINDAGTLYKWAIQEAAGKRWDGDFVGNENGFFVDTNWYRGIRTNKWHGMAIHWKRPDLIVGGETISRGHYTGLDPNKNMAMNPDRTLALVKPTGKYSLFYAREVA
jgi:hypothetical protein